ncbi:MAG: molybdopterin-dependent oxidoreductase, partial [Candidatus Latescibacteria bacterium]|nr:molybdopterin-dependent oxidoreductase [Candidatus Latescibacterota bacterium]
VEPASDAGFVVFGDLGMYTTSLPIDACLDDDAILAHSHDGEPLSPEHGAPLRMVVPKRYGWKSCKWVRTIEFVARDQFGFWETRGYSNTAFPFDDDRFSR